MYSWEFAPRVAGYELLDEMLYRHQGRAKTVASIEALHTFQVDLGVVFERFMSRPGFAVG